MLLSRQVDNFRNILVDIIYEILHKRPEILSSGKSMVSTDEVLKFKRHEDLVHYIIEKKIDSLSYQGIHEIKIWCDEKGIPLVISDTSMETLKEIIATRNIIVHNRGYVNEVYWRVVKNPKLKIGEKKKSNMNISMMLVAT